MNTHVFNKYTRFTQIGLVSKKCFAIIFHEKNDSYMKHEFLKMKSLLWILIFENKNVLIFEKRKWKLVY